MLRCTRKLQIVVLLRIPAALQNCTDSPFGSNMDVRIIRPASPRVAALPRDGSLWRISWFGSVAFPNRNDKWTQPSVSVVLSRCVNPDGDRFPTEVCEVEPESQCRWVAVGTLSALRTGDIWQNQSLVSTPDYEIATFQDLLVHDTTSLIIKAGFEVESSGFLLPFSQHPWHKGDTHSKCLLIELPEQRNLVVPCIEIIRFYFGSSSDLLSRLFHTPLSPSDLFVRADHSVSGFRMELDLADGIPRASASDVARIAGSRMAWRAAISISTSCARASASGHRAYPSAHFPFRGRTDLVASGQWLGSDRRTFLVYNLRSCSHPFPFRTLRYRVGPQTVENVHRRSTAHKESRAGRSSSSSSSAALRERDPSARLTRSNWLIDRFSRFPDLEKKSIWKDHSHVPMPPAPGRRRSHAGNEDLALGIGVGSGGIRPLTIAYLEQAIPSAPFFLRELLMALQALRGIRLTHLTSQGEDGWSVLLTLDDNARLDSGAESFNKRVAGFVLEYSVERWFLVVAIDDNPTCILMCGVPFNEHGEAVIGEPDAVRREWAGYLCRQEEPELAVDLADDASSELMCTWICEQLANSPGNGSPL